MNSLSIIRAKRDGRSLSPSDIMEFIAGYTTGAVPDYQMAAFLMAVYFRGLNADETTALTEAMVASGTRVDLSSIPGFKVDKHSTGGVGDTTSLILVPLLAAAGLPVAKMAGRSLGHTGGTIDKLEAIPGFRTEYSPDEFVALVRRAGAAIVAQSDALAPADGKLYALRDVTGTVESPPLIAASIMSKKIAAGADGFVLDVKTGKGAFCPELRDARHLAELMVTIGRAAGKPVRALITRNDEPLGRAVGNALEVEEAIAVLTGRVRGEPLIELVTELGAEALAMAGAVSTVPEGRRTVIRLLASGRGAEQFMRLIENQGGDPRVVEDTGRLPKSPCRLEVRAVRGGWIHGIDPVAIGNVCRRLGAGRWRKGDPIDPSVGVVLAARTGAQVEPGQVIAYVHCREPDPAAVEAVRAAFTWGEGPPLPRPPLIVERHISGPYSA